MTRLLFRLLPLGLLVGALATLPAAAQEKLQPKEGDKAVLGGLQDKLESKENGRLSELRNGTRPVSDDAKANQEVLAKAARYYVYRLTMPLYWGIGEDDKGKTNDTRTMTDLVREAHDQLLLNFIRKKQPLKPNQPEYLAAYSKEMIKCLREVFSKNGEPIVRVNAARILAGIAEAGQDDAADTLVTLVENPRELDAVKLYALRGIKDLLALGTPEKSIFKSEAVEARCIEAAQKFLVRQVDVPTDPGEREALNYVRREAVRALAQSRYATVPKSKGDTGRTAWWLLKVARRDGLTPDPSVSEQLEAAIGVCQLQPGKELNVDYAAHHVAGAVVDFLIEYANQRGSGGGAGLPWKLYSTRMSIALDDLQAHGKSKYVEEVVRRCKEALKPVDAGKDANPATLDDWLKATPPPGKSVYNGLDAPIKPGEAR